MSTPSKGRTAGVRKHEELSDDDLSDDEELLKDRMLGIADELEIIKEEKNKKKQSGQKKAKAWTRPVLDQVPTEEHLLVRETLEATVKWNKEMHDKYMDGVVMEMEDKIMEHINNKTEFPFSDSGVYRKWTKEMMEEARAGWRKHKIFFETIRKYPRQNMEQRYVPETGKWVMLDCSDLKKG